MQAIKAVVVGYAGSGKSSLIRKLRNEQIENAHIPTIGVEVCPIVIGNNVYNFWDCAGMEKYKVLGDCYYLGSQVALIVCDVTNKKSFDEAEILLDELPATSKKIIVINKIDSENHVSENIMNKFICPKISISALSGEGLEALKNEIIS